MEMVEGLVTVYPYKRRRVGFIQTKLAGTRDTMLDKTATTLAGRLAALGGGMCLVDEYRCVHDPLVLAHTITALQVAQNCDLVVISTASATVDTADVLPMAIR